MLCSENELNLSEESDGIIELKNKEKEIGRVILKLNQRNLLIFQLLQIEQTVLGIRGIARDLSSAGVGKLIQIKRKKIKQ